ncbi:retrovirus-related pol polyprotein from transposon TNT 1-94 [Tanacetum coccineum]|uniref:Retrovirus-related pol polyprotein from transposon TNT 1-94 n=1 Tax=Tanacetum coccineum TaxID=301880 RepID=A0ABQ5B2B3_9ASTR
MTEQDSPPPTITAMKIPIIKKGEYDIWSMRMRQYICHTDHNLWDIIVDGDLQEEAAPAGEQSGPPAPKTAKQLTAKRNQERVKSILLLAIPDEYLLKFHNVPDAKSLWAAIKSRFGGNDESKKMQRNVLKHQFENFTTAPNESLDKAYDRFQKLISQLEVHAAPVSKEDINQKFLRSLPPSWSQIALIMRNKPDIDQTDIDDLYNNLRVYEDEMKRSSSSTSNSQNLAFLSSENTSSTNEVSTASGNFGVNTAGGTSSTNQVSSTPGADEVVCSFFAQQTTSPPLDNEDLQQIDQDDLEELDIRWQVAMLTVRVQRFIQKTGRNLDFKGKQPVTFDKSKVKCYNCHRKGHIAKECKLKRNQGKISYGDNGRRNATTNEPSSQALVAQDGLGGYDWSNDFDEPANYALMAISYSSSSSSFDNEKVVKERDELKDKIAKWEESSKNLDEILNSQMSARDKTGLGYGTQLNELSSNHETDSENSLSIFDVRSSDEENTPENDRFSKNGYKVVPPPITGNFLTLDLNTKTSETAGQTNDANTKKPKSASESVVSNPKIDRDRVIIEDWNSDDEEEVNEVQTVRPETQTVKTRDDKSGQNSQKQGISFRKVNRLVLTRAVVNTGKGKLDTDLKKSRWVWRPKGNYLDHVSKDSESFRLKKGNPKILLQDHAVVESGCTSHMTGNKAYLSDYEDFNGGFETFRSDPKGDHLGKFDGKADEGFFVGYSLNSKAFRVFNSRTRIVEENLHFRFSKNTANVVGSGPDWLFNIDVLTRTMNYKPIVVGTQSNGFAGTKASDNADPMSSQDDGSKHSSDDEKKVDEDPRKDTVGGKTSIELLDDPNMPALEDISIFDLSRDNEDVGAEADMNNLDTTIQVSPIPTTRIHKDHPLNQVIRDLQSATQTRNMSKNLEEYGKNPKRNKKDERGIVIRNKARLVAQGYTQEEGIDYDEVFAPVARIKAIRLFLAYALFKDFVVYQMDVNNAFLYGKIEDEVYVCQPLGFEDPDFPDRVYKVEKALYGLHQAPRAWYETLSIYLLDNEFQRGKIDKTLFIKRYKGDILMVQQKKDGIFISQDKYVNEILKKFRFIEVKTTSTPIETQKPLLKDEDGEEVDVHMYRSMIGSLMYLTSSRPDIMFVYPKDSPFDLVAYTDSDYAGAILDRKSTTGGCLFLGSRLISWQCKKHTVVANSTTEAEYVAASSCCGQVLWI